MRPTREQREGAGAPKRACPPLPPVPCPGRRAQEGVGKVSLSVSLSVNRPFLPLLQMSESETLISMVNRMVESSSPRAQLFMQVRPLLAAWALSTPCQLLVHGPVTPRGWGLPRPTHSSAGPQLPGSARSPSFNATVFPSFFMFTGKPTSHLPNHQNSTDISCLPGSTDLLFNASILYLASSPQTLLGVRAWVCDREPFKASGVKRALWLPDASRRAGSMCRTQRHFCVCISPG